MNAGHILYITAEITRISSVPYSGQASRYRIFSDSGEFNLNLEFYLLPTNTFIIFCV